MAVQYRIGDKFITHEESRVSLVKIVGTRRQPEIKRIEFLSDRVDNANALIELVKATSREMGVPWNTSFFDGKILAPYRIKKQIEPSALQPSADAAVLGGWSNFIPTGAMVLGGVAGAKQRLETDPVGAIAQLLNYGEEGRDIAIIYLQENADDNLLFEKYWSFGEFVFSTPDQILHCLDRICHSEVKGQAKLRMKAGWLVQLSTCKIVSDALGGLVRQAEDHAEPISDGPQNDRVWEIPVCDRSALGWDRVTLRIRIAIRWANPHQIELRGRYASHLVVSEKGTARWTTSINYMTHDVLNVGVQVIKAALHAQYPHLPLSPSHKKGN